MTGTPIGSGDAWLMFEKWKSARAEIGVLFHGLSGSVTTTGTVTSANMGRLQLNSPTAEISFRFKDVNFSYGPVQMFPRWPNPPMVEVIALQAWFANGDWVALAERFRPESLP
jgi:hypothetical protein